ncbi:acyl-CoA carboxylase subunit epsilon [Streptomyces pimonensis]|uniref:Acyl-CoA carboxylase subunit epsilon n=1 Tax=Streptomyces pimonensis TaxID=2860288 RepID=A0ABV4J8S2_9ACTN
MHRGQPESHELAALVAVLMSRADPRQSASEEGHDGVRTAARWQRPERNIRYVSLHSWRTERG